MAEFKTQWVEAMRMGNFPAAWRLSEQALGNRNHATRDDPSLPYHLRWVWDGCDLAQQHVLVRCYHGLGDTIQFARFLQPLAERAASVTVEVQHRLLPLLERMAHREGQTAVRFVPFDPARPLPRCECEVEITELDFALRALPWAAPAPYLHALPAPLPHDTVGLCYGAGDWDRERCIPPDLLAPICEQVPCITLMPEPTELKVANKWGCPLDIEKTASLIGGCSLIITVDTMVAHLSGAMGKPTWLLLKQKPDWRWSPERRCSIWYPSIWLYAQPKPGDWETVVKQVLHDLANRERGEPKGVSVSGYVARPSVPVSWGELIDKITILEIKRDRLTNPAARANVIKEHALLSAIGGQVIHGSRMADLVQELKRVNEELWQVEDAIREQEARQQFQSTFIQLARSVYRKNDRRAALKRQINDLLGSELIEEKSYAGMKMPAV